ncbi:hypothetical protein Tco_0025548 [Tanacetum coccineum]
MEHYLAHTDYPIWEVIQNGNGPVSITTDTQGQIKVLPPRTAEEIVARERERKARTTLLMALPEDHLAKFHKMTDAKEMWDAIKSRFGGNDESKKMQKYILKQQFEGFSVSNSEGLHKGYDRIKENKIIGGGNQGTLEIRIGKQNGRRRTLKHMVTIDETGGMHAYPHPEWELYANLTDIEVDSSQFTYGIPKQLNLVNLKSNTSKLETCEIYISTEPL